MRIIFLLVITFFWSGMAFGAHPLITDDSGTVGKGTFQLELNAGYDHDDVEGVTSETTEISTILTYGVTETVDIVFGVPYQFIKEEDGETLDENGFSDIGVELKWRFYEKEGLGLALKPGITIPTGDDEKGLGAGQATYSLILITTKEFDPWAFHLNLGYMRNENKTDERDDLWHASLALETGVTENLTLVSNIGIERNPDRESNTHPAFILGGLIYSLSENVGIDFGVKGGLNEPESDYSILGGIALSF
jgi:hypothetical protein